MLLAVSRLRTAWPKSCASLGAHGEIAQLVEHTTENRGVPGSSPGLAIEEGPVDQGPFSWSRSSAEECRPATNRREYPIGYPMAALFCRPDGLQRGVRAAASARDPLSVHPAQPGAV